MARVILRIVLDVAITFVLALLLLTVWQWFLSGQADDSFAEGARLLINFMDVGLAIWVVLLIVTAFRGRARAAGPGAGLTFAFALVGVVLNLIVVTIVGFVQGGWGPLLIVFAIEAGIAVLLAAAVVVPLVHRFVKPPAP